MTVKKRTERRIISSLVVVCMLAGLLFIGFSTPLIARASGDVIINGPEPQPLVGRFGAGDMAWDFYDHPYADVAGYGGYDKAYTPKVSEARYGFATPHHIVSLNDDIFFNGYGIAPYLDYVFARPDALTNISFTLHPEQMEFHSFSEMGFLFNGSFTESGGKKYYTGYALILKCANSAGMMEKDPSAPNNASLGVYYLNNELWDTEDFKPGDVSSTRQLRGMLVPEIKDKDNTAYNIRVEFATQTRVELNGVERLNIPLDSSGRGFGFYAGYYEHNCDILNLLNFYDVIIEAQTPKPAPAEAQVKFMAANTQIRVPETETGFIGQTYTVHPPTRILYEGKLYEYSYSNMSDLPLYDINLVYRSGGINNNTTILYYVEIDPSVYQKEPQKDARVNEGEWENGTLENPVPVALADEIEYRVTAYEPPQGVAMMTLGNNGDVDNDNWWRQTTSNNSLRIRKDRVNSISFIDLDGKLDIELTTTDAAAL
ncbi:MAG: hypothetical protein FWG43_06195, partial [Clostridiales bacterium]|nr:hypothetical protein [Clostridiales bacterium]